MVIFCAYFAAVFFGGEIIPLAEYIGPLNWNWGGKIAAIFLTLASFGVLALTTKSVTPASVGFMLRQQSGSLLPAAIAIILLTASVIGLEIWSANGRSIDPERLAYQATMPGLDEEPFFRGLFLAVLAMAVPSGGVNLLGARINLAGLLTTVLFGLGHGLAVSGGEISLSWFAIGVTGYLGFGLLWIRERTGSVVPAIIGHNVINVVPSFF